MNNHGGNGEKQALVPPAAAATASNNQNQQALAALSQLLLSGLNTTTNSGGINNNNHSSVAAPGPGPVTAPTPTMMGQLPTTFANKSSNFDTNSSITAPSMTAGISFAGNSVIGAPPPVGATPTQAIAPSFPLMNAAQDHTMLPQMIQSLLNGPLNAMSPPPSTAPAIFVPTFHQVFSSVAPPVPISAPSMMVPSPGAGLVPPPQDASVAATTVAIQDLLQQAMTAPNGPANMAAIIAALTAAALGPINHGSSPPAAAPFFTNQHQFQESSPVAGPATAHAHGSQLHWKQTNASISREENPTTAKKKRSKKKKSAPELAANVASPTTTKNPTMSENIDDIDWGRPGVDYTCFPCPARSIAATDHYRTGVLRIPTNVQHAQELLCSHPACRSKGVRFLYCGFCEQPVAKANFGTRHRHLEEKQRQAKEAESAKMQKGDDSKPSVSGSGKKRKKDMDRRRKSKKKKRKDRDADETKDGREALLRSSAFSALLGVASAAMPQEDGATTAFTAATSNNNTAAIAGNGEAAVSNPKELRLSLHGDQVEGASSMLKTSPDDMNVPTEAKRSMAGNGDEKAISPTSKDEWGTSCDLGDVPDTILFRMKGKRRRTGDSKRAAEPGIAVASGKSDQAPTLQEVAIGTAKKGSRKEGDNVAGNTAGVEYELGTEVPALIPNNKDGNEKGSLDTDKTNKAIVQNEGISGIDPEQLCSWRALLNSRPLNFSDQATTEQWVNKVMRVSEPASVATAAPASEDPANDAAPAPVIIVNENTLKRRRHAAGNERVKLTL